MCIYTRVEALLSLVSQGPIRNIGDPFSRVEGNKFFLDWTCPFKKLLTTFQDAKNAPIWYNYCGGIVVDGHCCVGCWTIGDNLKECMQGFVCIQRLNSKNKDSYKGKGRKRKGICRICWRENMCWIPSFAWNASLEQWKSGGKSGRNED